MGFFNKKVKKDDEGKDHAKGIRQEGLEIDKEKEDRAKLSKTPVDKKSAAVLGEVIVQPRVSEKAGALAKLNKYAFVIKKSTNKVEVKKAIEKIYKVRVTGVNVINVLGKEKHRGRIVGRTGDFKKAIVTLKQGDRIEGITETA